MKIRRGFVSNSSSSSFVLAVPPDFGLDTPFILSYDILLGDLPRLELITTEKELREITIELAGEKPLESVSYKNAVNAIQAGKTVLFGIVNTQDYYGSNSVATFALIGKKIRRVYSGGKEIPDFELLQEVTEMVSFHGFFGETFVPIFMAAIPKDFDVTKRLTVEVPYDFRNMSHDLYIGNYILPTRIETEMELRKYCINNWGEEEFQDFKDTQSYQRQLHFLQQGKGIYAGIVCSDSGSHINAHIRFNGFGDHIIEPDIVVVQDCEE
ncbi:MAG: hypothetical protein ACE5OZ_11475 [Candidatus Heimdallarchaeota archaeon]